jgi:hypothetical protein
MRGAFPEANYAQRRVEMVLFDRAKRDVGKTDAQRVF